MSNYLIPLAGALAMLDGTAEVINDQTLLQKLKETRTRLLRVPRTLTQEITINEAMDCYPDLPEGEQDDALNMYASGLLLLPEWCPDEDWTEEEWIEDLRADFSERTVQLYNAAKQEIAPCLP